MSATTVLFVHNNFPGQFKPLAAALGLDPDYEVVAIGARHAQALPGVALHRYEMPAQDVLRTHPFARRFDLECRRAEQVLYTAAMLASSGLRPDTIVVHSGWGENLPLRAVFPKARIIAYCEFYYRPDGQDVNFDPEFPALTLDGVTNLMAKNANQLLALVDCDAGLAPTPWQKSTFPKEFHDTIAVIHEGVDTKAAQPDATASVEVRPGLRLSRADEVVTFVSRNLEPLRGYHVFLRALPRILRERPNAQVIIVGDDQSGYGQSPPLGTTWKALFLKDIDDAVDLTRVHFMGPLAHEAYLRVLQISTAHVYLTYPFVLSWSCVEAMSTGCTIVAADVAPVRDVLDETCGILVPFFDITEIARQVVEVLRNPGRYKDLGQRARARALAQYDAATICVPKLKTLLRPT